MKALLLNGPPRSGKDTIGGMLWGQLPRSHLHKFAAPIVSFMLREFGIDMSRVSKDNPHTSLRGRTPREVAIRYSEGFIKPLFGQNWFGEMALEEMRSLAVQGQELVIFTDSGFLHEAVPLLRSLGSTNVLQVRLTRPGATYQGDSRSTWDHPEIGHVDFDNDSRCLEDLKIKVAADLLPEIMPWLLK